MSQDIFLKYTYTKEEYKRAVVLHYKNVLEIKKYIIFSIFLLLFSLLCLYYFGYSIIWISTIILSLLLLFMVFSAFFILPSFVYNRNPKLKDEYYLTFRKDGIGFKTDKIDSNLEWSIYKTIVEDKQFFLLYTDKFYFTVIPKRAFINNEEIDDFRILLKQNISGNHKFII
ncbi:MAG: YcxB family protein [Candidatus Sericytochromatia bacterium]|nr:YcxB family protein [Candidatus Sericytochromatia bacterium]